MLLRGVCSLIDSEHYVRVSFVSASKQAKSNGQKLPAKSGESGKSAGGGTCKTKEIQSESSDSDDSVTSEEEQVVIRPRFVAGEEKKETTSGGASGKKGQRSKSPSGGGGGKVRLTAAQL